MLSRLGPALLVEGGSGGWVGSVGGKDGLVSVRDGISGGGEINEG